MTVKTVERLVGTPVRRREDVRLLLGQASFVADLHAPRMLHMAIVRSPVAHARIDGIDLLAARAMRGVRLILTGNDIELVSRSTALIRQVRGYH